MRSVRRWRWPALAAVAALMVGSVGYRVFAPTEVSTAATGPYPAPASVFPYATTGPDVIGTLAAMPLFVDGRLRVYVGTRQVVADQPIDAQARLTPYWSYRRWPAQVTGIVAAGATVVSRWSDGELVALDARTGHVDWRATGPDRKDHEYAGGSTGYTTVYDPPGLHTGRTRDGRVILVAAGDTETRGFDLGVGRELWRMERDAACRPEGFTTTCGLFATVEGCGSGPAVDFYDLGTGERSARWSPGQAEDASPAPTPSASPAPPASQPVEVAPVGCGPARSGCAGMRTAAAGDSRGWLLDGGAPVAAPALDPPDAHLVDSTVVRAGGNGSVTSRSARTGDQQWQRDVAPGTRVLAVQPGRVHLLTPGRHLMTLDAATGRTLSFFLATVGQQKTNWVPGHVAASDGMLLVERLAEPARPDHDEARAAFAVQPVLLAVT